MPCGGIYPMKPAVVPTKWYDDCTFCNQFLDDNGARPTGYVEEWDGLVVHADCTLPYLETEEGAVVNNHRHEVWINGEEVYREGFPRIDLRMVRRAGYLGGIGLSMAGFTAAFWAIFWNHPEAALAFMMTAPGVAVVVVGCFQWLRARFTGSR